MQGGKSSCFEVMDHDVIRNLQVHKYAQPEETASTYLKELLESIEDSHAQEGHQQH